MASGVCWVGVVGWGAFSYQWFLPVYFCWDKSQNMIKALFQYHTVSSELLMQAPEFFKCVYELSTDVVRSVNLSFWAEIVLLVNRIEYIHFTVFLRFWFLHFTKCSLSWEILKLVQSFLFSLLHKGLRIEPFCAIFKKLRLLYWHMFCSPICINHSFLIFSFLIWRKLNLGQPGTWPLIPSIWTFLVL